MECHRQDAGFEEDNMTHYPECTQRLRDFLQWPEYDDGKEYRCLICATLTDLVDRLKNIILEEHCASEDRCDICAGMDLALLLIEGNKHDGKGTR